MRIFLNLISILLLCSCGTNSTEEQNVKVNRLEIGNNDKKQGRADTPTSQQTKSIDFITDPSASKVTASSLTDHLIGYWFTPHAAMINIKFAKDKSFLFNDYNSALQKDIQHRGQYTLKGNTLILLYDDNTKQAFQFYKGKGNDDNYYIKKQGYYFVKGEG